MVRRYYYIVIFKGIYKYIYTNIIKTMKKLLSIVTNLHTSLSFQTRFKKSGPTCRRQVVNPRHQTLQGPSFAQLHVITTILVLREILVTPWNDWYYFTTDGIVTEIIWNQYWKVKMKSCINCNLLILSFQYILSKNDKRISFLWILVPV